MNTWPNTLPDKPLASGYNEQARSSTTRLDPSLGSSIERNRYNAVPSDVTEIYSLTKDQWLILESFFVTTSKGGVLPFTKKHPFRDVDKNYKFKSYPDFVFNGTRYVVTCQLEMLA